MRKNLLIVLAALMIVAVPLAASVEEPNHEATSDLTQDALLEAIEAGKFGLKDLRQMGLLVFRTPFNSLDGLGDGPFELSEWQSPEGPVAFGHRATLQGNGQHLRVAGLDAQSCNECHGFVKHSTLPPELGLAGVGGVVQNAIILPSLIDVADSWDDRVSYQPFHVPDLPLEADGVADFNGRFANPPFLYGGGGVELLAKEMTADLQNLLAAAESAPAGAVVSLDTHGVNFGYIVSYGGGNVEIHNEGIDEDLVVKPFGRKGENFSMRDFDRGAMQFHFGIQPEELFGLEDEDWDGVTREVSIAEMSVLHVFDVSNPRPLKIKSNSVELAQKQDRGKEIFKDVGCTACHMPQLVTYRPNVPVAYPEIPEDPWANVYYEVSLPWVGFDKASTGGVIVPLYADLKRHYMGPGLEEDFDAFHGSDIGNGEFTTARLWGIADTEPYLHDGRATTLHQAISMHGGEAQSARDNYLALPEDDQRALIGFLKTLRTPDKPNEDLLPINL